MSTTKREQLVQEVFDAGERQGNLVILFTNALANHLGLSAVEFECLSLLRDGPLSAGQLAKCCGLTSGAMTGLLDRLERANYLERGVDPYDRRKVLARMKSEKDLRKKATELYQPFGKELYGVLNKYTDAELEIILDYTKQINAAFERLTATLPRQ